MPQFSIEKVAPTTCNEQFHLGKHYTDYTLNIRAQEKGERGRPDLDALVRKDNIDSVCCIGNGKGASAWVERKGRKAKSMPILYNCEEGTQSWQRGSGHAKGRRFHLLFRSPFSLSELRNFVLRPLVCVCRVCVHTRTSRHCCGRSFPPLSNPTTHLRAQLSSLSLRIVIATRRKGGRVQRTSLFLSLFEGLFC